MLGLEKVVFDDYLDMCVEVVLMGDDLWEWCEKVEELVFVLGGCKK